MRYLISLIFVLASSGTVFGQISFDAPRAYPVPSNVFALGDFTSDGLPDVVAGSSQTLYVLIGQGDGTFGKPLPVHTAATADAFTALTVADFNRDNHADIALGSPGSIVVLLGDGRLGFQVKATYVLTTGPHDLTAGDFTGDDVLDLVSSYEGFPGNITFLKGNGDGTFQPPNAGSTGGASTRAADFDSDGFLDLLSADSPILIAFPGSRIGGNLSFLRGDGAGNFAAGPYIRSLVGELVVGDVNHDGMQDFVARTYSGAVTLVVFLGNGDGTFDEKLEARIPDVGPSRMALGDLNGDGNLDLVSPADFAWPVRLGRGDGTFSPPGPVAGGVPQDTRWSVTLADLNADGKLDVVGSGGTGPNGSNGAVRISVNLGLGDGSFNGFLKTPEPETRPFTVTADFDRDGRPDLASVDGCVRLGNGNGFGPPACQPANALDVYPSAFAPLVGDVNGDSIPDLVRNSTNSTGSVLVIVVMAGNADGTLRPAQVTPYPRSALAWFFGGPTVLGDFNGDSRLDFAAFLGSTFLNNRLVLAIFPGRGDGSFAAPVLRFATNYYAEPVFMLTTDFNGDRNADLLVGGMVDSSGSHVLTMLTGNGDGTFVQKNSSLGAWRPRGAAIADINGDGLQDIALAMFAPGIGMGTGILLGNGNGSFSFRSFQYAVFLSNGEATEMTEPILADLDGDHKIDMLMRGNVGRRGYVMAWKGIGDGTFAAGATFESTGYTFGVDPAQVFLADFDVDGKPDLIYNARYLIRNTSN